MFHAQSHAGSDAALHVNAPSAALPDTTANVFPRHLTFKEGNSLPLVIFGHHIMFDHIYVTKNGSSKW